MIGAGVGAVIGGGFELGKQLISGGEVNWRKVGAAALSGGISGGVAGATGGFSVVAQAASGISANIGAGVVERAVDGDATSLAFNANDALTDGLAGAVGFGIGRRFNFGELSAEQFKLSGFYRGNYMNASNEWRRVKQRSLSRQASALNHFKMLEEYVRTASRSGEALTDKIVEQYIRAGMTLVAPGPKAYVIVDDRLDFDIERIKRLNAIK